MRRLTCSEIWGGIKDTDLDVCSAGATVSLYSGSSEGGKGGDIYYFSVCGSDRLTRLVLADVAGHGQQVSEVSQWLYRQLAQHMDDPDQATILSELNHQVATKGFGAITTAAVVTCRHPARQVVFSYAGHPAMYTRNGNRWTSLSLPATRDAANLPLGVSENTHYDVSDVTLAPGSRLFLYSDGLLEAPNARGEFFGSGRLRSAIEEARDASPMELKTHVLSKLRQWTGGSLNHDDVTLIAIELS